MQTGSTTEVVANDVLSKLKLELKPVVFDNVAATYGHFHVLKDINLDVASGERIVVCGPSGSGKSTLIRCINRLEEHQRGSISVNGIALNDSIKNLDAIRREVGMVFQHFNLFPHLTVKENCALPQILSRGKRRRDAEEMAMHFLGKVRIPEQADKFPGQLSGGQQQRVAIARALHDPEDHAVRRADISTRSGNGQGGSRHHGRAGRGRHDKHRGNA